MVHSQREQCLGGAPRAEEVWQGRIYAEESGIGDAGNHTARADAEMVVVVVKDWA